MDEISNDDPAVRPVTGVIKLAAVTDGTSNTLMATDCAAGPLVAGAPRTRVSDVYTIPGGVAPVGRQSTRWYGFGG